MPRWTGCWSVSPTSRPRLAKRHLTHGTLVLYDVSSSYMEGRCCPLAKRGYSRDGRKGTLQIVYCLLCGPDGCPPCLANGGTEFIEPVLSISQIPLQFLERLLDLEQLQVERPEF